MQFPQIDPRSGAADLSASLQGSRESASKKQPSTGVSAEFIEADTLSASITTSGGDTATFSVESLSYGKLTASGSGNGTQSITDYIGKDYSNALMEWKKRLLEDLSGTQSDDKQNVSGTGAAQASSGDLAIPEYWNADNTSSRIVNFAVSFFSSFSGEGSEFLAKIKDAIEKGFEQARGVLGRMPDKVESLVSDTYDQVMQKLDAWAKEKGITPTGNESTGAVES